MLLNLFGLAFLQVFQIFTTHQLFNIIIPYTIFYKCNVQQY